MSPKTIKNAQRAKLHKQQQTKQKMRSAAQQLSKSRLKDNQIRIVSYNILAEKYSGSNAYCPQEFLSWEYRCPRLLQQLQLASPDLVCLQEVQEDVYQTVLQPWMSQHGYSSLYNPRPSAAGSTTGGPMDGVSLHFRDDLFSLQASQQVRFADHAQQLLPQHCCSLHQSMMEQQQQQRRRQQQQQQQCGDQSTFMEALLQRQEGAVMALLQHKATQQQLLACSTHLHWNPNFPDVKVAQAAILCYCISTFIKQQQRRHGGPASKQQPLQQQQQQHQRSSSSSSSLAGMPIVVGGDFNSTWRKFTSDTWDEVPPRGSLVSGVYELLSQGQVPPSHPDHPSNRRLCSQCSRLEQRGGSKSPQRPSQQQKQQQPQQKLQLQQQQVEHLLGHTFTTSGLQLESSHFRVHGREPTLTTRTNSFSGCLDYIWLSKRHWQVQSTLQLPFQEPSGEPGPPDRVKLDTCPNQHQPSDHLLIGCDVVLMPSAGAAAEATPSAAAAAAADKVSKMVAS